MVERWLLLTKDSRWRLYEQYAYCYEELAKISAWFRCRKMAPEQQGRESAYTEMARLFHIAESKYINIYQRGMFFSPSYYATEPQPYGPYSEYCCLQDDPLTAITVECTRLAKLAKISI
jgi:hypothetical protein